MTQEDFELALDQGRVKANMGRGHWWKVRRNGRTKVWKTRPGEFRIPIKIGFREYGIVDHNNLNSPELRIDP